MVRDSLSLLNWFSIQSKFLLLCHRSWTMILTEAEQGCYISINLQDHHAWHVVVSSGLRSSINISKNVESEAMGEEEFLPCIVIVDIKINTNYIWDLIFVTSKGLLMFAIYTYWRRDICRWRKNWWRKNWKRNLKQIVLWYYVKLDKLPTKNKLVINGLVYFYFIYCLKSFSTTYMKYFVSTTSIWDNGLTSVNIIMFEQKSIGQL